MSSQESLRNDERELELRHIYNVKSKDTADSQRRPAARSLILAILSVAAAAIWWPAAGLAADAEGPGSPGCANVSSRGLTRQLNLHAAEILAKCGVLVGGPAGKAGGSSPTVGPHADLAASSAFSGSDVDVITGEESFPQVTESESVVAPHGNTIVVVYNDSRGDTEFPQNFSGVSVSKDGGATFTRLGPKSPLVGHVNNFGDPAAAYDAKLGKWFVADMSGGEQSGEVGCGNQGIGLWTSTNGEKWVVGACAHSGSDDDHDSMWVDNNPGSPYYGRIYVSFNNFAVGNGDLQVVYSNDGVTWTTPTTLSEGLRRNVQLTGSPASDGTVFLVGLDENGGHVGKTGLQNYMYRSTNGGVTWTSTTMGPTFTMFGSQACGYWSVVPPNWRGFGGAGQPAAGPNGVVQYVYAAHGSGSDESDIFYVRSSDKGLTWSAPLRLNTDNSGRAQWMPSLRVTATGVTEATWYDRRDTTNGENYERFARISPNDGVTWGPDQALSGSLSPQPEQWDPTFAGCYAGDYNYTSAGEAVGYDTWTEGLEYESPRTITEKVFFHSIPLPTPAPVATTTAVTGATTFRAGLNGTVNPEGQQTTYHFEYGETTAYGSSTPAVPIGAGIQGVGAQETVTKLKAGATYHYRLVATSVGGTSYGEDVSFVVPGVEWRLAGTALSRAASVAWGGEHLTLTVNTVLGVMSVSCLSSSGSALVGPGLAGSVTRLEDLICKVTKTGVCKEGESAELTPVNLPWNSELAVVAGATREVLVSGGKGNPGFKMKCNGASDQCTGKLQLTATNGTGAVNLAVLASEKPVCETGTGTLEGSLGVSSKEGSLTTVPAAEAAKLAEAEWRLGGTALIEPVPVAWKGKVRLAITTILGSATAECEDTGAGSAGANMIGSTTTWTLSKCTITAGTLCPVGEAAKVTTPGMPWSSELLTVAGAVRDQLVGSGNGQAGFELACGSNGVSDLCTNPVLTTTNTTSGVTATFLASEKVTCEVGTGTFEGTQTIEATKGGKLEA